MDFIKKHYEKVLLGIVLVGLAGAAAVLPFFISSEQAKLKDLTEMILHPKVTPLTNINLAPLEATLKRVATPAVLDLSAPNRLFNPMPWQQTPPPERALILAERVGPTSLVVTNINPLYLKLSLDSVTTSDSGPKYIIGIEKPAPTGIQKVKTQTTCAMNPPTRTKDFQMVEIKGPAEDPTQITVELSDTKERAVIAKDKPFRRVEGYTADLIYEPEKKHWDNLRVNYRPPPAFAGEEYNIVAINQTEVVLSAKSNGKKWTIKATPTSSP
jgi:hypothetical protein